MDSEVAYAELGLAPGASEDEVKTAWRRLVSRWHPDRNPSGHAVDRIQRINTAYEHIRAWFDDTGAGAAAPRRESPPPAAPARTTHRKLRLSLEDAALGCVRLVRGRVNCACEACEGQGQHVDDAACPACRGRGTVVRPNWYGWFAKSEPCEACSGDGRARHECAECAGSGRHVTAYRRRVRIPAGVRHGVVLCADGSPDDPAGVLELVVEIAPHKFFVLGDDGVVRCDVPVDGFAWTAGRWTDVPTLAGLRQMRLQRGRHVYRLRGVGFPVQRRGEPGDCIVTVVPMFPPSLSADHEALLDQIIAANADTGPLRTWERKLAGGTRERRTRRRPAQEGLIRA